MVVTAGKNYQTGDLSRVEAFDLEDTSTRTCQPITNYPQTQYGMAVGVMQGVIKSCGGYKEPKIACYDYNPDSNTWIQSPNMTAKRVYHGHSFIDDKWLLSGGYVPDQVSPSNATEYWDGNEFHVGPPLPRAMHAHCQLTLNHTHVFFTAGDGLASYLLYWPDWTWTELPAITKNYAWPSCGLIKNPNNGREAVIAGEEKNEIFNFKNLTWRDGPTVPYFIYAGYTQLSDTFLVVGGKHSSSYSYLSTIYKFNNINYEWVQLCRNLQTKSGYYPGVVTVPDSFVNCSYS